MRYATKLFEVYWSEKITKSFWINSIQRLLCLLHFRNYFNCDIPLLRKLNHTKLDFWTKTHHVAFLMTKNNHWHGTANQSVLFQSCFATFKKIMTFSPALICLGYLWKSIIAKLRNIYPYGVKQRGTGFFTHNFKLVLPTFPSNLVGRPLRVKYSHQ